jgi:hypothetical protein
MKLKNIILKIKNEKRIKKIHKIAIKRIRTKLNIKIN